MPCTGPRALYIYPNNWYKSVYSGAIFIATKILLYSASHSYLYSYIYQHISTNVTLDPVVDNDSSPNTNGIETVSCKKVKGVDFSAEENDFLSGCRLIDMEILHSIIKSVACPKCFIVGSMALVQNAKYGIAFKFCVCCNNCKDWNNEFMTSTKKSKKFDISYKAVYAMRRCGKVFADCLPLLTIHHLWLRKIIGKYHIHSL